MKRLFMIVSILCSALLTGACATIPSDFVQPGVSVVSIAPRALNNLSPEFDVVLRVTNPNRKALQIAGMAYQIWLDGRKLIDGVASDLPEIAAYGEGEVSLLARADLVGVLGLFSELLSASRDSLDYEFDAQIDLGALYPTLMVRRSGTVSLR